MDEVRIVDPTLRDGDISLWEERQQIFQYETKRDRLNIWREPIRVLAPKGVFATTVKMIGRRR
ncbi:MAG: hypothetical protein ACREQ2_28280 [Candidatus Binatia bacterium]